MGNTKFNPNQLPDTIPQPFSITLTPTQIKTLRASPITLISAPGVGFVIRILAANYTYIAGTTPYTVGSNKKLQLFYGSSEPFDYSVLADGLLNAADSTFIYAGIDFASGTPTLLSSLENLPIVLHQNDSVEFADGDGTCKVTINYTIDPVS